MRVIDVDALNEKLEHLAIQRIKGDDGYDVLTVSLAEVLRMIDGLSTIELETTFADRMSRKLDALGLPVREYNCLRRYGIDTIAELYKVQQDGMLPKVRNLGRKSMERVEKALDEFIRVEQLPPTQLSTNLAEVGTDCSEFPNNSDTISREAVADAINGIECTRHTTWYEFYQKVMTAVEKLPPAEPKTGKWILGRSGAYCCSECMEPCAGYVMMKPRDKFCKMCGSRNEVTT